MGSRSHQHPRCDTCHLHVELCLCHTLPTLDLSTQVVLVLHYREARRPTNTGALALAALKRSELVMHGLPHQPLDLSAHHDERRRVCLLYPAQDAPVLAPDAAGRPTTLIVPDGNWGQGRRIARRVAALPFVEPVGLPPGPPTRYRLRDEPKAEGLATMEAIARALGVLEGPVVQRQLEAVFDRYVERALWSRQRSGAPPR